MCEVIERFLDVKVSFISDDNFSLRAMFALG